MRRREQREHIFKLLFMTEFNSQEEMTEQVSLYFDGLEELEDKDKEYMREKYAHVLEHLGEIDQTLDGISKGWKTKRMSRVDLTALRLAVYELKFDNDVPVGVAINEAVELAKRFGGETSGSFVNGILGKIANGDAAQESAAGTAAEGTVTAEAESEDSEAAGTFAQEAPTTAGEAHASTQGRGRTRSTFGNSDGKIIVVHKNVGTGDRRPARDRQPAEGSKGDCEE